MPPFSLPTYDAFAALRLDQFLPSEDLVPLTDWQYLGHRWVGQAWGFTSILQLESEPDRTRAIDIVMDELENPSSVAMLAALGLPLRRGMNAQDVIAVFGPPTELFSFVSDRTSYEFLIGDPPYHVGCTCMHDDGLSFVTMHTPLPPEEEW